MSGYRTRPASFADIAHILPLVTALARSFGPDYPEPDPVKIDDELRRVLRHGFVLVAEAPAGNLVGVLGLERGEFSYSSAKVLLDRFFYAVPGTQAGGMLALSARSIGRALELPVYLTRFREAVTRL